MVAAESPLPKAMAYDRNGRMACYLVFADEQTALFRLDSKDPKEIRRGHRQIDALGVGAGCDGRPEGLGAGSGRTRRGIRARTSRDSRVASEDCGKVTEHRILGAPVEKICRCHLDSLPVFVDFLNSDDAVGLWIRQRAKQYRVYHAEDGGICPDAQRDGQHGDGGKAWSLEHRSQAEAQVLR